MALLFIDSFDHYDTASVLDKWTSNFTPSTIEVGKGRCGTNCMKLGTFEDLLKGVLFTSLTGTVGFAACVISHETVTAAEIHLSTLGGSYPQAHLTLWYHAIDGSLSVVRNSSSDVLLGQTVPDVIRQDDWYYIEWRATIDPAVGAVTVRVNNVEVIAVTGVNTLGDIGASNPFPLDLRSVGFHCGSNEAWRLDDVYILDSTGPAPNNTFLGDCRVEYLKPRAAGTYQQWPIVVGTSGSHWLAVNDNAVPDEDATYVEANAPGLTDSNLYQPTGLPSGPIFGAQLSLHAKKTEIGPRVVAPVVNAVTGPPHFSPSAETYRYLHTMFPTNPTTGLPWTIAEINAIDAGVTVIT
jgi:hypothetical protein